MSERKEYTRQRAGRGKTVKYATAERLARVNPDSVKKYETYIRSNVVRNRDVASTTYKVYRSYFNIFLCYILEEHDNFYVLDEEYLEEHMIDVMEGFMAFLQEDLGNNKKSINTKLSAISSFNIWAVQRRELKTHPFDGRLKRMEGAQDEKIISEHFLTQEQVDEIDAEMSEAGMSHSSYDLMDKVIWHVAFDSACRIGALAGLKVSKFDPDNNRFVDIREKRGKMVSIPFSTKTKEMIEEFIAQREALGVDCDELFYSTRGGKWGGMSKQAISNRIKKMGYILKIGDFRPHSIRKTRLNMVFKKDTSLAQQLANHSDVGTTQRHYSEPEDQKDVFAKIEELGL